MSREKTPFHATVETPRWGVSIENAGSSLRPETRGVSTNGNLRTYQGLHGPNLGELGVLAVQLTRHEVLRHFYRHIQQDLRVGFALGVVAEAGDAAAAEGFVQQKVYGVDTGEIEALHVSVH